MLHAHRKLKLFIYENIGNVFHSTMINQNDLKKSEWHSRNQMETLPQSMSTQLLLISTEDACLFAVQGVSRAAPTWAGNDLEWEIKAGENSWGEARNSGECFDGGSCFTRTCCCRRACWYCCISKKKNNEVNLTRVMASSMKYSTSYWIDSGHFLNNRIRI